MLRILVLIMCFRPLSWISTSRGIRIQPSFLVRPKNIIIPPTSKAPSRGHSEGSSYYNAISACLGALPSAPPINPGTGTKPKTGQVEYARGETGYATEYSIVSTTARYRVAVARGWSVGSAVSHTTLT